MPNTNSPAKVKISRIRLRRKWIKASICQDNSTTLWHATRKFKHKRQIRLFVNDFFFFFVKRTIARCQRHRFLSLTIHFLTMRMLFVQFNDCFFFFFLFVRNSFTLYNSFSFISSATNSETDTYWCESARGKPLMSFLPHPPSRYRIFANLELFQFHMTAESLWSELLLKSMVFKYVSQVLFHFQVFRKILFVVASVTSG